MLAPSIAHSASATLSFSSTTITFPSADPDVVPAVAATENPLQVQVIVSGTILSQLTAQAGGDLRSGANSIAISNVTWTAQGSGFVSGQLSSSSSQRVGQWFFNKNVTGQLRFWLANSWSYATGNYSQTVVYTLIAY